MTKPNEIAPKGASPTESALPWAEIHSSAYWYVYGYHQQEGPNIVNGRLVPESQARALWEGARMLCDNTVKTPEGNLCVLDAEIATNALTLLRKGIGE